VIFYGRSVIAIVGGMRVIMQRMSDIILALAIILNLGWLGLNVRSSAWVPVPADSHKSENGTIFVHVNWYRGGDVIWIPMMTAVMCLVVAALQSAAQKSGKRNSNQTVERTSAPRSGPDPS
jgi:ribose/xylose/arabinose/galactoside ABC-type transport system permease subunit